MIFPSLATGDGTYERTKFRVDMHFSARQSKATNPSSHTEASRSFTRPVPANHPLDHPLLKLQQTIGNQGAQRLLHSQPVQGLRPSQGGLLQRKCACGGTPGLDGECAECRQKRLSRQRHPTSQPEAAAVPPIVHEVLRSSGQPLDPATRAFMEPRFGHDFGRVRVHTDARAAESTRAVNALAYTVSGDIVFGAGQYVPGTGAGRRVIAHELTHTIQQDGVGDTSPVQSPMSAAMAVDHEAESEAERAATDVTAGRPAANVGAGTAHPSLQRQVYGAPVPTVCSPALEELVTQVSTVQAAKMGRPLSEGGERLARGIFGTSIDYT